MLNQNYCKQNQKKIKIHLTIVRWEMALSNNISYQEGNNDITVLNNHIYSLNNSNIIKSILTLNLKIGQIY